MLHTETARMLSVCSLNLLFVLYGRMLPRWLQGSHGKANLPLGAVQKHPKNVPRLLGAMPGHTGARVLAGNCLG